MTFEVNHVTKMRIVSLRLAHVCICLCVNVSMGMGIYEMYLLRAKVIAMFPVATFGWMKMTENVR